MYFIPVVKQHASHHASNSVNLGASCYVNVNIIFPLLENYLCDSLNDRKKSQPVGKDNLCLNSLFSNCLSIFCRYLMDLSLATSSCATNQTLSAFILTAGITTLSTSKATGAMWMRRFTMSFIIVSTVCILYT
uniref:Uncharacterized protein n=2 Tax=environmental samples TaxID=651140 RepID=A0A075I1F4_9ARCH|nr:hypothetical protein [uncultured marine thaumarchaeote SAT1000_05_A05]AIF21615.1 hypothetical protein [uncultured marine thaumarchaeote SAT1000_05_B05]